MGKAATALSCMLNTVTVLFVAGVWMFMAIHGADAYGQPKCYAPVEYPSGLDVGMRDETIHCLMAKLDSNADDAISEAEFNTFVAPFRFVPVKWSQALQRCDCNGDGSLTREEIHSASQSCLVHKAILWPAHKYLCKGIEA